MLSQYLQFLIGGVTSGAVYGLTALGFTLIYNATGIINFAQGDFVMIGGMTAWYMHSVLDLPLVVACLLAVLITALVGLIFERLAIYPQRRAPITTLIIITIGGSTLFKGLAMKVFGEDPHGLPYFLNASAIDIGGAVIHPQALIVLGTTALAVLVLQLFFYRTMLGKSMRACADSREGARAVGINASRVSMISFALSAGLGALAGVVIAPISLTAFNVGGIIGLKGFAAAILGGMGNPVGAVFGGLLLGALESLSTGFISAGYHDAISLAVLLLVLFFRPQGLLSRSGGRKA